MFHYGHGSWIALVVFGAVLLIRALTSQSRRQGSPRRRTPGNRFTGSHPGPASGSSATRPDSPTGGAQPAEQTTAHKIAPGWFTDPTGRHSQRYWSGTGWTEHVLDDGVPGTEPPPGAKRDGVL